MEAFEKELLSIFSSEIFSKLLHSDTLKIAELNAIITLLITTCIPFDIEYSPGTKRLASAAELTIYINPTTSINITINLNSGGSIFSGKVV